MAKHFSRVFKFYELSSLTYLKHSPVRHLTKLDSDQSVAFTWLTNPYHIKPSLSVGLRGWNIERDFHSFSTDTNPPSQPESLFMDVKQSFPFNRIAKAGLWQRCLCYL